jgi:uncharacterized membrane protein YidH (DUF202 family)
VTTEQEPFDTLADERTALSWERTAVATMVTGTLLARFASESGYEFLVPLGLLQVVVGAIVLAWAGRHYDDLYGLIGEGQSPVHPTAIRAVALATIVFSGAALVVVAVAVTLR